MFFGDKNGNVCFISSLSVSVETRLTSHLLTCNALHFIQHFFTVLNGDSFQLCNALHILLQFYDDISFL